MLKGQDFPTTPNGSVVHALLFDCGNKQATNNSGFTIFYFRMAVLAHFGTKTCLYVVDFELTAQSGVKRDLIILLKLR